MYNVQSISPYKNCLSDIAVKLNDSCDDKNDFSSPDVRIQKRIKKTLVVEKKKPIYKKTKESSIVTSIKENFTNSDCNPEHLQLALALSKSVSDSECSSESQSADGSVYEAAYSANTESKRTAIKQTLEQFGFKTNRSLADTNKEWPVVEVKKRKYSKFKFITPVLLLRTQEDRESIIANKISMVLNRSGKFCGSQPKYESEEIFESGLLKKFHSWEKPIFILNRLDISAVKIDSFYVKKINLERRSSKCGCLLKNWDSIPGREKSPTREIDTNEESSNKKDISNTQQNRGTMKDKTEISQKAYEKFAENDCPVECDRRSISPDLFDSSQEEEFHDISVECVKTDTGICHIESFNAESHKLTQIFIDLTQNSEDKCENVSEPSKTTYSETEGNLSTSGSRNVRQEIQNLVLRSDEGDCSLDEKIDVEDDEEVSVSSYEPNLLNIEKDSTEQEINEISVNNFENDTSSKVPVDLENNTSQKNYIKGLLGSRNNQTERKELVSSSDEDHSISADESFLQKSFQDEDLGVTPFQEDTICYTQGTSFNEINARFSAYPTEVTKMNVTNVLKEHQSFNSVSSDEPSQQSQESIVISDDELNYSSIYSTPKIGSCGNRQTKISSGVNTGNLETSVVASVVTIRDEEIEQEDTDDINVSHSEINAAQLLEKSYSIFENADLINKINGDIIDGFRPSTSVADNGVVCESPKTPKQDSIIDSKQKLILKTTNVTPMLKYDEMNTPKITQELQKFGLKSLKRQRGVQLLKYIYETTHPVVGSEAVSHIVESTREGAVKKRKLNNRSEERDANIECISTEIHIAGDLLTDRTSLDDLIFERKFSTKVASCRVPIHIAWHNLVSSNKNIQENILLYEPLQLEELYAMFKSQGFKFHIEDLLRFLDRKCITVRTNQNNAKKFKRIPKR